MSDQYREKLWELLKDVRYSMISHTTETLSLIHI